MTLKILHVLASPHAGGAEWMCLHLAREQQARGHDVGVLFFEAGAASDLAKQMGLRVTVQNVTTYSRRARWQGYAQGLTRLVQTRRPDVVHSHVPLTNLICNRTLPKLKIPWVCTIHGSWRQFAYAPAIAGKPWLKPYLLVRHALGDRLATRSAAKIVAISDYIRQELSSIGVSARKVQTIHDGLPINSLTLTAEEGRRRLGLPHDALVIGSLGYFSPVKGFDVLIRAFATLLKNSPNLLLLIAGGDVLGNSAYRHSLSALISELRLDGQVTMLGTVAPGEGFLSALDIFVVASRTEGFSLSLVEAMQHGRPSVVTSAGGSLEAARPGIEALVFQSENVSDLAQKLSVLIADTDLRDVFGKAAAERARTHLNIDRCATEYETLYRSVINK